MRRADRIRVFTTVGAAVTAMFWSTSRGVVTQQPAAQYGVTDVGTLGGATSTALGINGSEFLVGVVGFAQTAGGQEHAFMGRLTGLADLGTLGGARSEARAVDQFIVGRAQTAAGKYHAFVVGSGPMMDLGTLGGSESYANGVISFALEGPPTGGPVVVGGSLVAGDAATRAFVYQQGAMTPLGATLGGTNSVATAINHRRQIVGYADRPGGAPHHAFLFDDGLTVDLGSLGTTSEAFAINDNGVVVGRSRLASGAQHAFRYQSGAMQDLGTLGGPASEALDVDDDESIVGWAERAPGDARAFIWRDGVMTDLNTLIKPGTGWVLRAATSSDDLTKKIVGYGERNGVRRGFVLTPAIDLRVDLRLHVNELDTNIPNPHEAGDELVLGASIYPVFEPGNPIEASNIVLVDTISGPFEYTGWSSNYATCQQAGQQRMSCTVRQFFGQADLFFQVRATGPGILQHTATIVQADQPDPNPANNSATESNRAISLASLTIDRTSVVGGGLALARATLTSPTGAGGSRITLASSRPDIASVPPFTDVMTGNGDPLWREFYVRTQPVTLPVTVQISATHGLVTKTVPLTVLPPGGQWPFGTGPRAIPGTIQVEDFDEGGEGNAYHDVSRGNSGGAYRSTDVDIQTTLDTGGGANVGWISAGEWLEYTVNVSAGGIYRLDARVASPGAGGAFHVEIDGANVSGALTVPNTGGWQTWTTVSRNVTLSAGQHVLRLAFDSVGANGAVGNFNFLRFTGVSVGSAPFGGKPWPVPGTIQAENFDEGGEGIGYHDLSSANNGGQYRSTGVDIQATRDAGGGFNVGWISAGEWLAYTVAVAEPGAYLVTVRVASDGPGGRFHIEANGANVTGPLTIPNTGGYQIWRDVTAVVTLGAGLQRVRFIADAASPSGVFGNLNYLRLTKTSP